MRTYWVYILTNAVNTTLYTGITNDIDRRIFEHRSKAAQGFTARYNLRKLIYVENFSDPLAAIAAEKQIKSWSRPKKLYLISQKNPNFEDLMP